MEFFTLSHTKRPVRLSDETRRFAEDSLHHRYGRETLKNPYVTLDHVADFEELLPLEQYNEAILAIATKAPLRICSGERISGAATLGYAIKHKVPAVYCGDLDHMISGVSHLTIDFETVLKRGVHAIKKDIQQSASRNCGAREQAFLKSALHCIGCFEIWHRRYLQILKNRAGYEENYQNLCQVPFQPARNFYEAVQSIWFTFAFVRLCGNWPGIGRLDALLGTYLKNDLQNGDLTREQAREILAHFLIKGCEWIAGGHYGSGDAQHYQNLVLAGVDESGEESANEVTELILDVLEELNISDFPTTVRVNRNTDQRLLERVAEVMRHGGGVLAVYNEDLILEALTEYGYSLKEARNFANDGCWEVQIPGKTYFTYVPFDALQIFQQVLWESVQADCSSYKALYTAFCAHLKQKIETIYQNKIKLFEVPRFAGDWRWRPATPCTVISLFEQGCIEKGRSYLEGGPVYNVISPHIGGVPDVANSLYVIQKLVFEEKRLSLRQFTEILQNDWRGQEALRQDILNHFSFFGNDHDTVDRIAAAILDDFAACCRSLDGRCPIRFPGGVSTFGRQIEWRNARLATAQGKKAGEILSGNFSPTPGTDMGGATAVIKSFCKADLRKQVTGAALDLKLLPSLVEGEEGKQALVSLIRGFVALGGFFMQPDVVDCAILKDAQQHPERYQSLSVRVSGWNARFVTMDREWQDMIIEKNAKGEL